MSCIVPIRIINPRYRKLIKVAERNKYDSFIELGISNFIRDIKQGIKPQDSEFSSFAGYAFNDNLYNYVDREDFFLDVPCGKCINCLKSRSNAWSLRLSYEYFYLSSEARQNSFFLTLTIKPEYYENISKQPHKYIRLFLDRCRKMCGHMPRHFIQNDFGETTNRYHFHAIFFDVPFDINELERLWKYGFVNYSPLTLSRIMYACKYTSKSVDELVLPPHFQPITFVSPGLGKAYADDDYNHRLHRLDNSPVPLMHSINDNIQAMPRYLRGKIFTPEECEELTQCYYANLSDDVIPDPPYRIGAITYDDYTLYLEDAKRVKELFSSYYPTKHYKPNSNIEL